MARRRSRPIWVVPDKSGTGTKWRVKKEKGNYVNKKRYNSKLEARKAALRKAKSQGVGVKVQKADGTMHYGYTADQCMHMHNDKI